MIGSYMNVMLYTLELVGAYIYYFASPRASKDPIFIKLFVATSVVSDTIGTIGVCAQPFIVSVPNAIISFFFFDSDLPKGQPCLYQYAANIYRFAAKY